MVDADIQKKTLEEIDMLSQQLYSRMKDIGYVSKDFWKFHDELLPLLIHGITEARKQHNEVMAQKFEELQDEVKDNTPSGYWKRPIITQLICSSIFRHVINAQSNCNLVQ